MKCLPLVMVIGCSLAHQAPSPASPAAAQAPIPPDAGAVVDGAQPDADRAIAEIARAAPESKAQLALVQAQSLVAADVAQLNADQKCHGFGLLTPLFGVSSRGVDRVNPNRRNELKLTGPIESGIGGGYYRAFGFDDDDVHKSRAHTCNEHVIIDWEVFGFSEGLNPSSTFQIGVGGGLGVTAWGKFQFGIALGYDLIRRETISTGGVSRTYSNGLLEWNDVTGCGTAWGGDGAARCAGRNFTWLLTFGVTSASGGGDRPKADPKEASSSGGGDKPTVPRAAPREAEDKPKPAPAAPPPTRQP